MDNNIRDKLGSLAVYERKIPFKVVNCTKSIEKYFKDDTKIGFITKDNKEKGIEVMDGRCPEGFRSTNTSYELVYKDIHPCDYNDWKGIPVFSIVITMTASMAYLKQGYGTVLGSLLVGYCASMFLVWEQKKCKNTEHLDWVQTKYFEEVKHCAPDEEISNALVSAGDHLEL